MCVTKTFFRHTCKVFVPPINMSAGKRNRSPSPSPHSSYERDVINQLTNNIMKKYHSEFELVNKLTNIKQNNKRNNCDLTSRSVSSLPLVRITGPDVAPEDQFTGADYLPTQTQSTPCSPRSVRKGFTTFLDGTQYIIGE